MSQQEIQVDAKLPLGKSLPLSFQHLFAMFGSTILVPVIFGIDPAIILLMNGIGTLLYIFITKGKIPAYLGSSFAFIAPLTAVKNAHPDGDWYGYALGGFLVIGLLLVLVGLIVKFVGTKWINVLFPPAAMGAIVAVIGLELIPVAAQNAGLISNGAQDWTMDPKIATVSILTFLFTIICWVTMRGFLKIIPILLGLIFGYVISFFFGILDFKTVASTPFFTMPELYTIKFSLSDILIILPAIFVLIPEHIGHLEVTSNIVKKDLAKDPGLDRSFIGNGVSTVLSSFVGSTPNTTYGENIGVLAITKVYSTWVIGGAAIIAIILSFFGKVSAVIAAIPSAVLGGISLLLFGIIAVSGLRMLVQSQVNYDKSQNLILTCVVLAVGLSGVSVNVGEVSLSGMGLATIVAMIVSLFFTLLNVLHLSNEETEEENKVA